MNEKELIETLDGVIAGAESLKEEQRELDQRAAGTVYLENALVHLREAQGNLQNKAGLPPARGKGKQPVPPS